MERIFGGELAPAGRYDYTGAIFNSTDFTFPECGASLIAPDVVITAQHCLLAVLTGQGPLSDLRISFSCLEHLAEDCEVFLFTGGKRMTSYEPNSYLDDVFVLQLDRRAEGIDPVKMLGSGGISQIANAMARAVGWGVFGSYGDLNFDDVTPLREVDLAVVERATCRSLFSGFTGGGQLADSIICLVGDHEDTCAGDSGGPIFIPCHPRLGGNGIGDSGDVLFALPSFGLGNCGKDGFPAFVTDLTLPRIHDFIVESVKQLRDGQLDVGTYPRFVESLEGYCPKKVGFFEQINPTPFPSKDFSLWSCPPEYIGDGVCDCGCTIIDDDCVHFQQSVENVRGCNGQQFCSEGVCTDTLEIPEAPTPSSGINQASPGDATPLGDFLYVVAGGLGVVAVVLVVMMFMLMKQEKKQRAEQKVILQPSTFNVSSSK